MYVHTVYMYKKDVLLCIEIQHTARYAVPEYAFLVLLVIFCRVSREEVWPIRLRVWRGSCSVDQLITVVRCCNEHEHVPGISDHRMYGTCNPALYEYMYIISYALYYRILIHMELL